VKHQIRISAQYRSEPDYGKLARGLLSILERKQAAKQAMASSNRPTTEGTSKPPLPQSAKQSEVAS
jgi:hypothetical protein